MSQVVQERPMKREPVLPAWTEELKLRYLAGEASMFLLHGNVRDVHAWTEPDVSWVSQLPSEFITKSCGPPGRILALVKTILLPSGDQLGLSPASVDKLSVSRRSPAPSALTV